MAGAITNESNAPAAALWFECVQLGAAGSVSQEIIMDIKKIGFIGLGVMGAPMAGHLLDAGFELKLYTRTKARAAELIARGATWCDTPADCAQDCDVVISIVGYPQDVREVWMGRHGAFNTMKPGSIGVDMTTSAPELAQELAKSAADKGFSVVDCPVTGGDIGARNAALTILCGGDKAAIDALEPVFKVVGKKWVYFGEAGMGQMAKACNQVAIASSMFSACEAIVFAKHMGLDPALAIETLCGGAAGSFSLQSYGPRILKGDFAPGFKINHFLKDMEIALKVCQNRGVSLPGLDLAYKAYSMLKQMGHGDKGTQALYLFYSSSLIPDFIENDAR